MQPSATALEQLGDATVLSLEQREAIARNGIITTADRHITIDRDLVRIEITGVSNVPTLMFDTRVVEEVLRLHRRAFLLLCDPRGTPIMPADCRRYIAEWNRKFPITAVAVVNNGNFGANAVLTLLTRAINMFRRKPMHFGLYTKETEARAWLESLRRDPGKSYD